MNKMQKYIQAVDAMTAKNEFLHWFNNSKVVDNRNQPLMCFHGGSKEIYDFRPLTHFGTLKAATARIKDQVNDFIYVKKDTMIHPVFLHITKPYEISDSKYEVHTPLTLGSYLAFGKCDPPRKDPERLEINNHIGVISLKDFERIEKTYIDNPKLLYALFLKIMEASGYDGFVYRNAIEDRGSTSWVITSPSQVWKID